MFRNSCDELHSIHECGLSGQLAAKLFNQSGFADAGLTDNQDELSGASKSAFRAAS